MPLIRRTKKAIRYPGKASHFAKKTASEYRYLFAQGSVIKPLSKSVAGITRYHPYLEYLRYENGRFATVPVRNFKMTVDLEDRSVGADLAVYGNREVTLADRYEELIAEQQPTTILDIGSNIGYYAILAGMTCDADIHAFEPHPANIELLQRNVALNDVTDSVTINQSAVSNKNVTIEIGVKSASNAHSMKKTQGDTIEVESTTIDAYCRQNNLDSVDVIRMDIEGAEISAIRGMKAVFEPSPPPAILFIELHPWLLSADEMAEFVSLLQLYGYELDLIISEGVISTPWPGAYDVSDPDALLSIERGVGVIATLVG